MTRPFPTTVYRVWATYSPKAAPPCRFTAMASVAYEKPERAAADMVKCAAAAATQTTAMSPRVRLDFLKRFGETAFEVRPEPVGQSVVLGNDDEWTPAPQACGCKGSTPAPPE